MHVARQNDSVPLGSSSGGLVVCRQGTSFAGIRLGSQLQASRQGLVFEGTWRHQKVMVKVRPAPWAFDLETCQEMCFVLELQTAARILNVGTGAVAMPALAAHLQGCAACHVCHSQVLLLHMVQRLQQEGALT